MNYYTAVMILMLMTLFILCILVWENGRIRSENKRIYYLTYFLIGHVHGLPLRLLKLPRTLPRSSVCSKPVIWKMPSM